MIKVIKLDLAPAEPDLYCPVLVCDTCDTMIRDGHMALYAYEVDQDTSEPATGKVYTVHKGSCYHALELTSIHRWHTIELRELPDKLKMNLKW